jgi:hypothetical protein
MPSRLTQRLGAASGIAYFVLTFVGSGINSDSDSLTLEERVRGWADASTRANTSAAIGLELLGFLCFALFLGYLWSVLRRAEGENGWLAASAFGGGLTALAIKLMSAVPLLAAFYGVAHGIDSPVAQTLQDMAAVIFMLSLLPLAVLLLPTAVLSIRAGALPRWLGWLALLVAVADLAAGGSGLMFGAAAFSGLPLVLFTFWTLLSSIVLTRRAGREIMPNAAPERVAVPNP